MCAREAESVCVRRREEEEGENRECLCVREEESVCV